MRIQPSLFTIGLLLLVFMILSPSPLLDAVPVLAVVAALGVWGAIVVRGKADNATRFAMAGLPFVLALLVYANGSLLDRSPNVTHDAKVTDAIYGGTFDVVTVESWRSGRDHEWLFTHEISLPQMMSNPVKAGEEQHGMFAPGHHISVDIKGGWLGLPWIADVRK